MLSHYNTCFNVFHAKYLKASVADSFAVDTCKKMASVAFPINVVDSGKRLAYVASCQVFHVTTSQKQLGQSNWSSTYCKQCSQFFFVHLWQTPSDLYELIECPQLRIIASKSSIHSPSKSTNPLHFLQNGNDLKKIPHS